MFAKASRNISLFFCQKGIIKESDIDIYTYSFEMLLSTVSNLLLLLFCGLLANELILAVAFSFMFLTLRPVCGGFHAVNHFWCCFTILCIFTGVLALVWFTPIYLIAWLIPAFSLFGLAVIWFMAPVEDHNKPLSEKEVAYFQKKARKYSVFFSMVIIILTFFFGESKILYTMSICMVLIAFMMLIAKYNNFRRKNHENIESSCP